MALAVFSISCSPVAVSAAAGTYPDCEDRSVAASAVRSRSDVRAFVQCAMEYLQEHGTQEAYRAFHEDGRWRHGPIYVFVDEATQASGEALAFVYPPDPSREGRAWGAAIDSFGTDYFDELHRMLEVVDEGWIYYSFPNPATGRETPKSSYVIEIDWNGARAAIGAGIYALDIPGTCNSDEVNAALLESAPSDGRLREFVRCAAMVLEAGGYPATAELERDPRWSKGTTYAFVLDLMGNQVLSGNKARVDGIAAHEWGGRGSAADQFGGRDMARVGAVFGEASVHYNAYHPVSGAYKPKVGTLKRVVAHGIPLLVGAGYFPQPGAPAAEARCSDNHATAAGVRGGGDVEAFVQCAAEYARMHGTGEARRAFHGEERWRLGSTYVFVDELVPVGQHPETLVFPPNPSIQGIEDVQSPDHFGTTISDEFSRTLSMVDSGWIHYAYTNPATGTVEPKSSYVKVIDWDGRRAVIGSGIYERDLPGACDSAGVNAAALEASPGLASLREFVTCAAHELEANGLFAAPMLSLDPRWRSGSIAVSGADVEAGRFVFSGDAGTLGLSADEYAQSLYEGRDVVRMGDLLGEAYLYSSGPHPLTGVARPRVAFVKRVVSQGRRFLVGSEILLEPSARPN